MTYSEARDNVEKMKIALKEKWIYLLEMDEDPGNDISFFDIGGNSLTAGILFSEIQNDLSIKIEISEIYDNDTINGLAELIVDKCKEK